LGGVLEGMRAGSVGEIIGAAHQEAKRKVEDHQWDAIGN
jgi:hypothetical protein